MKAFRWLVAGWVLSASVLAASPQQPPAATFRSGAQLTVVDVTVTGSDGRPIEGLTAADFAISEDGEPQAISLLAFQRVDALDGAAPRRPSSQRLPSGRRAMSGIGTGASSCCISI